MKRGGDGQRRVTRWGWSVQSVNLRLTAVAIARLLPGGAKSNLAESTPASVRRLADGVSMATCIFTRAFACGLIAALLFTHQAAAQGATGSYGLSGVTVYDRDHLLSFAYQHVERSGGQVSPDRLADAIELIYREDGYMLAEIEIVYRDGFVVDFIVHEGFIEAVEIAGVDERLFGAIRGYVEPLIGRKPLHQKDFERAIMLAGDLAGLSITTEITYPGTTEGALLTVHGETRRQSGSVTVDNPPRQLGEAVSAYGNQEFYSLLIPGDMLRLAGSVTWHFRNGQGFAASGTAFYRAPLGASGLYGEVYAGNVIGRRDASGTFVATDLRGLEAGGALGYAIRRDVHNYAYVIGEFRHSQAVSSGGGVSFASGVNVISALIVIGHDDAHGSPTRFGMVLSGGARSGMLPVGIDDGDDRFWHLRASLALSRPLHVLHHNLAVRFALNGQISSSRLPSVEEFYLGGRNSLRGYRFGEAGGDSGFSGTIEVSYLHDVRSDALRALTSFLFADAGFVANNAPRPGELAQIWLASAGAGLQADFARGLSLRGWVGVPLVNGVMTGQLQPAAYLGVTKAW